MKYQEFVVIWIKIPQISRNYTVYNEVPFCGACRQDTGAHTHELNLVKSLVRVLPKRSLRLCFVEN